MTKIKKSYLVFIITITCCLLPTFFYAQTKSTESKTINGKKYYIHKVEKGQSLYAIAKLYQVDINYILAENDEAIDGIKPGQEIKIPIASTQTSLAPTTIDTNTYVYHKVTKGETVYAITKRFTIDEKQLTSYNPSLAKGLKEGDYIIVGKKTKKVNTPTQTISTNKLNTYTVLKSETLYSISKKLNINEEDLITLNPEIKVGLKEGQLLNITAKKITPIENGEVITKQAAIKNDVIKSLDTLVAIKPKKDTYKIGLFLPIKGSEVDNINIDDLIKNKQSFPQVLALVNDFYFGFKKAMDSLQEKDFETELVLYDVQEKDSAKIEAICKSEDFKKLDMIFGPLYPTEFKIVSNYAKKMGIPAVSPLTQQTKILFNNPRVSKTNPSIHVLIEELAKYAADSLLNNTKMMIVTGTSKDYNYIKTFKKQYNNEILSKGKSIKDTISEVRGLSGVKGAYAPDKKNVVVLLTNNLVFIQDFITQLYQFSDKKDIVLMGFSNITNIDNLDQEYLNQLHFHFPTASQVNYEDSLTLNLVKQYQTIFGADPSDIYFNAFDIGYYYLSNLKQHGPLFTNSLQNYNWEGVSTHFKFYRPDNDTGFENKFSFIYKYSNYKLQRIGWK